MIRAVLLGVAVGLLLILATAQSTNAAHHTLMSDNPDKVMQGAVGRSLFGVNVDWYFNGTGNLLCSDYGAYSNLPIPIRDAVSAWELVLPATQFITNCSGGHSATWILRRSQSGWPCDKWWMVACALFDPVVDKTRNATYVGSTRIYWNDTLTWDGPSRVAGYGYH